MTLLGSFSLGVIMWEQPSSVHHSQRFRPCRCHLNGRKRRIRARMVIPRPHPHPHLHPDLQPSSSWPHRTVPCRFPFRWRCTNCLNYAKYARHIIRAAAEPAPAPGHGPAAGARSLRHMETTATMATLSNSFSELMKVACEVLASASVSVCVRARARAWPQNP